MKRSATHRVNMAYVYDHPLTCVFVSCQKR